jgi:two-component system phosphate regulon sensor histidine kinase PhoR
MGKDIIVEAIAREMHTGVLAVDKNGKALYANPFFLKAFPVAGGVEGKPISEVIGNATLLKAVSAAFMPPVMPLCDDIEISETGRVFKARLVALGEAGQAVLVFLQDITEEKRVETIKKDFVANVSHELRTPLASIKGYSETLLDGAVEEKATLKEFLRIIDRHATRMARLIDDLLVLSKLESHQLSMHPAPLDIRELIHTTVKGFGKQAKDKGITISAEVPDSLSKVIGDRDRLEQVVVNLLDNAIKYTQVGGLVSISAHKADNSVRVDVSDTGLGIPEEDIPRIFERFYRVDKARSRELGGTGLGLAIVKHIIQAHGGKMNVKSAPGKGSTFSFSLAIQGAKP